MCAISSYFENKSAVLNIANECYLYCFSEEEEKHLKQLYFCVFWLVQLVSVSRLTLEAEIKSTTT